MGIILILVSINVILCILLGIWILNILDSHMALHKWSSLILMLLIEFVIMGLLPLGLSIIMCSKLI